MTTRTTIRAVTTKTRTSKPRARGGFLFAVALGAVLSAGVNTATGAPTVRGSGVLGETTKVPKLRTIEGTVCSKEGSPIQGAVVYLQDSKSLSVKSYLSDAKGEFHFRQLSMNADFELWAELNGKRSKSKNISQFNSKTDLTYKLKLPDSK